MTSSQKNTIGRYELLTQIGSGGMSAIYEAYDPLLHRHVAIKKVYTTTEHLIYNSSPGNVDMGTALQREAEFMAQLEHPYILPIYDYGLDEKNQPFVVMRLVKGKTWGDIKKPLKSQDTLRFASQVASAIDYLHSKGIIHRDIKPNNILLSEDNHPFLADFGLSIDGDSIDPTNDVAGTLAYMAPEIFEGNAATVQSDIYAFGLILFECFTGVPPFSHDSLPLMIQQILASQVPSIHGLHPDIPFGVDVVIDRLVRRNPVERYTSATEAVDALTKAYYSGHTQVDGTLFVSYARKDSDYVHSIANELRNLGIDLWIDRDIKPSTSWDEEVEKALKQCKNMIIFLSPNSVESKNVQDEWSFFLEEGKPIYPVVYVPCSIPFRLRRRQYITSSSDILNDISKIIEMITKPDTDTT